MLGQVMSAIVTLLQIWITRVMSIPGNFDPSVAEHVAVLDAIEAGNTTAARAAMHAHMDAAYRRLETTLPDAIGDGAHGMRPLEPADTIGA
jgi:DNA-binding GntR family transcriptional regulator